MPSEVSLVFVQDSFCRRFPKMLHNRLVIFFHFILFVLLAHARSAHGTSDALQNNASKPEFRIRVSNSCGTEKNAECESVAFGIRDYFMFPNSTVYIRSYNLVLNECSYTMERYRIIVCKSLLHQEYEVLVIPCGVQLALCISVFSVLLPLFFSMLTQDVRDLVHVNWRGLILSVFFFHFLLQTVNLDRVSDVQEFSYTFPALMHFFTLALLSWMTILYHDGMMMCESVFDPNPNFMELMRNFRGNILGISTAMILLVTVTLLTEVFGIIPSNYKPQTADFCWLTQRTLVLFFTGPVMAFSLINFLNFMSTYIYFRRRRTAFDGPLLILKKNYLVHFKLFVIVDITWLVGVLVFLTESDCLWRIFVSVFVFEEVFIVAVPFHGTVEKWVLGKLSGD